MRRPLIPVIVLLGCTGASAFAADVPHAQILKRHGVVYGVRGIAQVKDCKYLEHEEMSDGCHLYASSGTIVSVSTDPYTRRIDGFMLRMANGRTQFQNFDPNYFPVAAKGLIRRGRRVRVSGTMAGQGQVAAPNEIILK